MTFDEILTLMPTFTAVAAIVAPTISTAITVRSNERMKRAEIYAPRLYAAVQRLSETYAKFNRSPIYSTTESPPQSVVETRAAAAYKEFSAAAYDVMALVADPDVHAQICDLLESLEKYPYVLSEQDAKFQALSESLAKTIAAQLSLKGKYVRSHRKSHKGK